MAMTPDQENAREERTGVPKAVRAAKRAAKAAARAARARVFSDLTDSEKDELLKRLLIDHGYISPDP